MDLQQKLEAANKKLEILNSVSKITSSTIGLKPRLDYICMSLKEIMDVKGVAVRLLDETTNKLELMSACGLSKAYLNKGPVDADKSLAQALRGKPHFVPDVTADFSLQYPYDAIKEGILSMLSYPLKGREKVIGTLRLYTSERREFTQDEMDFLAALAGQGAIHIENAKIYETLKRQNEAKNEFIMLMTHELKSTLMAIQGYLEVMRKGYLGPLIPRQIELTERIERRAGSVLEIIKGLIDIFHWQSTRSEVERAPISLKTQIERALDLLKPMAEEKGVTITTHFSWEDPLLVSNEEETEKILNNLLTNAIKYTPTGGSIFVGTSVSEKYVSLKVKDTGIGMSPEDIPNIFKEFFRTKRAKAVDPHGTGLGMTLVKKIVESLGGKITISSEDRGGTEFILTFPRSQEQNHEKPSPLQPVNPSDQ